MLDERVPDSHLELADPAGSARALLRRLESAGPDALESAELLALLLDRVGGTRGVRALAGVDGGGRASGPTRAGCEPAGERARRLLATLDLIALSRASPGHLRRGLGLSPLCSARISAAFALGRRVEAAVREPRRPLRSPALVHDLMAGEMRGLERETFHALLLDGKHRLRCRVHVSQGTLTSSLVHPREVFGPALREGAAALIVVHNHPSGDPEPSTEDLAVTRRLIEVGNLLGVPLLDHVVVAEERYVSIRERMRFDPA